MADNKKLLIAIATGAALVGGAIIFSYLSGKSDS